MHILRMEKIKMKGLQEYVEQMKDCLQEQKDVDQKIHLGEILMTDKIIDEFKDELG